MLGAWFPNHLQHPFQSANQHQGLQVVFSKSNGQTTPQAGETMTNSDSYTRHQSPPEKEIAKPPLSSSTLGMQIAEEHSLSVLPLPHYFTAAQLHRRPTPTRPVIPAYPVEMIGINGHVILLLLVNQTGQLDHIRVIESSDPRFVQASVQAFESVDYAPGTIAGTPVNGQLMVEINFNSAADQSVAPEAQTWILQSTTKAR